MTPDGPREDGFPEESVEARGMSRHRETQAKPGPDAQTKPQTAPPAQPNASVPSAGVVWVRISPSQVVRTVVVALLTAAVVLGALFSAVASTHLRRLVRHRPVSGGGAQLLPLQGDRARAPTAGGHQARGGGDGARVPRRAEIRGRRRATTTPRSTPFGSSRYWREAL
jgi:hypothetical protein